jgi:predicted alpha-1,2-mannosidase
LESDWIALVKRWKQRVGFGVRCNLQTHWKRSHILQGLARKTFMTKRFGLVLMALGVVGTALAQNAQNAKSVDPLAGIDAGGNTFPGASLPFGMLKAGPDMGANNGNAGWVAGQPINGFSQTHVSGTGGGCKYGNILVQPTTGSPTAGAFASPERGERASAGYFGVMLTRFNIEAEMTAARRTAVYRFNYPAGARKNIEIDVAHLLSSYANQNEGQSLVGSEARVVSPTEVQGHTTVTGGWNKQTTDYTVYFYAATDVAASASGTWKGNALGNGKQVTGGAGEPAGAWMSFPDGPSRAVQLKVGISFLSEAQAKANALSEVRGFDFEGTRAAALAAWDKVLAPVQVKGVSDQDRSMLYTALYHTMLMPVDRTGENPLWTSSEPYYDDYYTIWDTFRSSSPLLTLIAQDRQVAMLRSLVDIYRHDGWLPDGRSGNFNGRTQGGSDADFVIVDAYVKKLPGIDWAAAYAAIRKDAEVDPKDQIKEGRGDLADWRNLGYLSMEGVDRPVSKGMEYAANDYEVALMAAGLGHAEEAAGYLKRSANWKNFWDPQASDGGFHGFVWARHRDGSWKVPFNALEESTWGGDTFYEGNSWTYSTFVPQDNAGLIRQAGGVDEFVRRMDAFFAVPKRYDVGNEPGFLAPYLYIWAGRQDRTADQIRNILAASFHAGRSGLPGNDDSGAMSSWYVLGKMGFYPNAGQDVYVIGSPAYPEVSLSLANGKVFTIRALNVSDQNRYIAKAEWNGKPYAKAWFRNEDLMAGGTLVLTMTSTPGTFATGELPPSSSTSSLKRLR